jgi:anti-sigma factor ChrR (cupin superfamily)
MAAITRNVVLDHLRREITRGEAQLDEAQAAGEGVWEPMGPGVTFKIVWQDRKAGRRGMLIRMAPGSVHPTHADELDEECLVLDGELRFDDLALAKGDFHLARKGYRHPLAVSATGCLIYISGGL